MPHPRASRRLVAGAIGVAASVWCGAAALGQSESPALDATLFKNLAWRHVGPGPEPAGTLGELAADTAFPYRICGSPPDAAPLCLDPRPDAAPAGGESQLPLSPGAVVADPADPEVLFTADGLRFDRRSAQATVIGPLDDPDVARRPGRVMFGPDGRTMYYATTRVWRTVNGGQTWASMSGDLTQPSLAPGDASPPAAAIIASIAPSTIDPRQVWAATSNGLLSRTTDGGVTWTAIQTPAVAGRSAAQVAASHFDVRSAYLVYRPNGATGGRPGTAASPSMFRTRDGGVSWSPLLDGLPVGDVHVVREDPFRRGFLLAGTDVGVYVSFDDGERWTSMRLNMPAVPIADIAFKDADLIVSAVGRGVWLLDDISPLRQTTADVARADLFLFRPSPAWRLRSSAIPPIPPALDAAGGSASGATFYYLLAPSVAGPVTIEVLETATGERIRRFSTDPSASDERLDPTPGLHRVTWDLRYTPARSADRQTLVAGVKVLPGIYQVRLTAGSRLIRQAISVRLDPRVRTPLPDLRAQFTLARRIAERRTAIAGAIDRRLGSGPTLDALRSAASDLARLARLVEQSDTRPTAVLLAQAEAALSQSASLLADP